MKRRTFIREGVRRVGGLGVGSLAAGSLIAGCSPTESGSSAAIVSQPTIRWRLVSSFPRSLDTLFGAAPDLAERVEALTDGRFQIRAYPSGEIVPALEVLDAVGGGMAEIGHSCGYYYKGKDPALCFDTAVPFGLTARQHSAWLLEAGGLELMREIYAGFGVHNLPGGNTGVQMGGWFREPVKSLADLKGLKMRIPGLGGEVMDSLGVTVQVIAGADIYPSLERGTIDATEWVGPYDDRKLGFHRIVKNYHYPGWWEPGPALSFYVNRDKWNALPKGYQAGLEAASRASALRMVSIDDAKNPVALKELVAEGTRLVPFPEDVMAAASKASAELLGDYASSSPGFGKVLAHWQAFREDSNAWFASAEREYLNFALPR